MRKIVVLRPLRIADSKISGRSSGSRSSYFRVFSPFGNDIIAVSSRLQHQGMLRLFTGFPSSADHMYIVC